MVVEARLLVEPLGLGLPQVASVQVARPEAHLELLLVVVAQSELLVGVAQAELRAAVDSLSLANKRSGN